MQMGSAHPLVLLFVCFLFCGAHLAEILNFGGLGRGGIRVPGIYAVRLKPTPTITPEPYGSDHCVLIRMTSGSRVEECSIQFPSLPGVQLGLLIVDGGVWGGCSNIFRGD